jgi:hypothetical protein
MSKRDTFVQNIRAITGCRSFKKAIEGWKVKQIINLPHSAPHAVCELCTTHFRSGAFVQHVVPSGTRPVTISVGGDCLETILLGRFTDRKVVAARKHATNAVIRNVYEGLIDPGAWISWVIDNAPKRFAPLVADLQRLGMVSSDEELKKLIAFHDQTRIYPRAALLPDWRSLDRHVGGIPVGLTLNEARRLLRRLNGADVERILLVRAKRYYKDSISASAAQDEPWATAWARLDRISRRMVVALCSLTDKATDGVPVNAERLMSGLRPMPSSPSTPCFAWHPTAGLGLIENGEVRSDGMANVWLWGSYDHHSYKLSYWHSVRPPSARLVREAEAQAFWTAPGWYKGDPLEHKLKRLPAERIASPADDQGDEDEGEPILDDAQLPPYFGMQPLFQAVQAGFRRRRSNRVHHRRNGWRPASGKPLDEAATV